MEALVITAKGVWVDVEILQWMERNTMVFKLEYLRHYIHDLACRSVETREYVDHEHSTYQSQRRIAEILGLKAELPRG